MITGQALSHLRRLAMLIGCTLGYPAASQQPTRSAMPLIIPTVPLPIGSGTRPACRHRF